MAPSVAPPSKSAVRLSPEDRRRLLGRTIALLQEGAFDRARLAIMPLYEAEPDGLESQLMLGAALAGCAQDAQAIPLLQRVAAMRPDAPHPVEDIIPLLLAQRALQRLDLFLHHAVEAAPEDIRLLAAAGEWLRQQSRDEEALPLLERALALAPTHRAARISLAALLADRGELAESSAALQALIAEQGGSAAAWGNLAIMLGHQHRFAEADSAFRRARALNPAEIHLAVSHGISVLKSGNLPGGWADLNRRLGLPGHALLTPQRLLPPLRPDQRLDGRTILVTHDSGYGDTLQFVRYLPMLQALGARVLLWVPPELARLMHSLRGVEVFTDRTFWPVYDWHCPAMRLPEVFSTALETIPGATPYLGVDPALVEAWADRLPPRQAPRRLGLVWAGSARREHPEFQAIDRRRSMRPEQLLPLFAVPGIEWVSLQKDRPPSGLPLHDPMPGVRDFADTAALLMNLDGLVSVDTSVVHLAGALGKPVYLLDRFDNCWRWLTDRRDSPWYPGLRIYRQERWSAWESVVSALARDLTAGR